MPGRATPVRNEDPFYIYNRHKREFLRGSVRNGTGNHPSVPIGQLYLTWTPSYHYGKQYMSTKCAIKRCEEINAQLGGEVCEVVFTDRAAKIEKENADYWRGKR